MYSSVAQTPISEFSPVKNDIWDKKEKGIKSYFASRAVKEHEEHVK